MVVVGGVGEGEGGVSARVVGRDAEKGTYVGYVPGFPGAHAQGETLDELNANLREAIGMLLDDGDPEIETEFVGTQTIKVA